VVWYAGILLADSGQMGSRPYDIRERAFLFACQVVSFGESVAEQGYVMRRLAGQLVDAAGSVGANLEEADAGQSKADFISKNSIALKECREARFWLRLISACNAQMQSSASPLVEESHELVAILTTIVINAKRNSPCRRDR
jgi:four helix bundle protein